MPAYILIPFASGVGAMVALEQSRVRCTARFLCEEECDR